MALVAFGKLVPSPLIGDHTQSRPLGAKTTEARITGGTRPNTQILCHRQLCCNGRRRRMQSLSAATKCSDTGEKCKAYCHGLFD